MEPAKRKAKRLTSPFAKATSAYGAMFRLPPTTNPAIEKLESDFKILNDQLNKAIEATANASRKLAQENKPKQRKQSEQQKQKKEALKSARAFEEIKRAQQKLEAKKEKERKRIFYEQEKKLVLPTRIIDESELVPVRLDAKTVVYVRPGTDPNEVKKKFRERTGNRSETP